MKQDLIVILDLGSTQNTVIAREIRDLGVYSEIHPHDISAETLKSFEWRREPCGRRTGRGNQPGALPAGLPYDFH